MRRWLVKMLVLLAGLGLATNAVAQEKEPSQQAKIVDQKTGVSVLRPDDWVAGKTKNGGAIAVFRASADSQAQIDVLVSGLERGSSAMAYFTSFHANLQKAGFVKREVRNESSYAGKKGVETEYDATSKKRQFRLIVWQYHKDGVAVLVTGFFPTADRDRYYDDLQGVIENLALN